MYYTIVEDLFLLIHRKHDWGRAYIIWTAIDLHSRFGIGIGRCMIVEIICWWAIIHECHGSDTLTWITTLPMRWYVWNGLWRRTALRRHVAMNATGATGSMRIQADKNVFRCDAHAEWSRSMEIRVARAHRRRTIVVDFVHHFRIIVQIRRGMLICWIVMALMMMVIVVMLLNGLFAARCQVRRRIPWWLEECCRIAHIIIDWIGRNILYEIRWFPEWFIDHGRNNVCVQIFQIGFSQCEIFAALWLCAWMIYESGDGVLLILSARSPRAVPIWCVATTAGAALAACCAASHHWSTFDPSRRHRFWTQVCTGAIGTNIIVLEDGVDRWTEFNRVERRRTLRRFRLVHIFC